MRRNPKGLCSLITLLGAIKMNSVLAERGVGRVIRSFSQREGG
ncbi:MAG: hypothetical protein WBW94_14720 [Anaerolineales bacterium]